MLLWGLGSGLFDAFVLWAVSPTRWPMMPFRASDLHASMAVLKQGGPLLLGRHGLAGPFYPIGSDETGIYVYLPLLSRLFGVADPVSMLRYSYVGLYGLTAASYPLVFYKLTRSMLAGFAAPIMLLACVLSMGFSDTYWILAWGALTLLPPIYLLARDWPRYGLWALAAISFAAGWLSSIRPNSGLPIVIASAVVLAIHRPRRWRVLTASGLLVVIAYISIGAFAFSAIRTESNRRLSDTVRREQPAPHVWHTLYIGLGYLPNSSGIRYKDQIAAARVQRAAPGTPYLSSRYVSVIRRAYFDAVSAHPLNVFWQYLAKAIVMAADIFPYLLLSLLTIPAMLLLGSDPRSTRRWILITVPVVILESTAAMVAIPVPSYELGLYGTLGVVAILGLCWTLAQFRTATVKHGALRSTAVAVWSARATPQGMWDRLIRSAQISGLGVAVFLALVIGGHFIRQSANHWQGARSGVLIEWIWK